MRYSLYLSRIDTRETTLFIILQKNNKNGPISGLFLHFLCYNHLKTA